MSACQILPAVLQTLPAVLQILSAVLQILPAVLQILPFMVARILRVVASHQLRLRQIKTIKSQT